MEVCVGALKTSRVLQVDALLAVAGGATLAEAGALVGVSGRSVGRFARERGGVKPRLVRQRAGSLTPADREEIRVGIDAGLSDAEIGRRVGRHRGTVGREIRSHGGRGGYRAWVAQAAADRSQCRPRERWTQARPLLWELVQAKLRVRWSPQQIAAWLRVEYRDQPDWWVSHESIYHAVFVQAKPELRRELAVCLRSGRAKRRPQGRAGKPARQRIPGMVNVSERPADVRDRALPGNWEGDLIIGKDGHSAVGTMVERSTRFGMLIQLNDRTAGHVADRIAEHIAQLPAHLARTLTWDQGSEMAAHQRFTIATGVDVYFCDPHSPWQRGSNENWNGLVRQYLPKGIDLSVYTQQQLNEIADEINGRPRQTLNWMTPSQQFNQLLVAATT